ncbi:MAG: DUF58 domain-containing protein [Verrucomicrobia bacterium]|nr:DUF58 domain-containing protein [Verrucomicrobiota bacterium]
MTAQEILKKIRQIELRTNRLVTETLGGQYHSVFKGQGMNFEEVREYQPGDDVRFIDWNVTARMNHPFIKKYVEERELTVMLVVDLSGSQWFGSARSSSSQPPSQASRGSSRPSSEAQQGQSKLELAAEIASVLAFSAIRNNDKVGLILYTDEIELYLPPRKGRRHVLRLIREILAFKAKGSGTRLNHALEFLNRVTSHRAIVPVISDFLRESSSRPGPNRPSGTRTPPPLPDTMGSDVITALRQTRRRHDVVAMQITDPLEHSLPPMGLISIEDPETGEQTLINTSSKARREYFAGRRSAKQAGMEKLFRSSRIDLLRLETGKAYSIELARFFETRQKRLQHR